jgi:hypothetical protein
METAVRQAVDRPEAGELQQAWPNYAFGQGNLLTGKVTPLPESIFRLDHVRLGDVCLAAVGITLAWPTPGEAWSRVVGACLVAAMLGTKGVLAMLYSEGTTRATHTKDPPDQQADIGPR